MCKDEKKIRVFDFFLFTQMNSQLTDLIIEERFEPLRAYFKDVMAEDLTSGLVSVEDILDATKPEHRLLMTVFIKKYLLPIGRPNSLIS